MSEAETRPPKDHNAPQPPAPLSTAEITAYLDYALDGLRKRRDDVIAALQETIRVHPTIADDDVLGEVAENVRIANALNRTGDERRKQHKEPFLHGGRAVDSWFAKWLTPLVTAIAPVQTAMNAYGELVEDRNRAAAQAESKRRQAESDAAQLKAAEALRQNQGSVAMDALEVASQAAQAAEDADALASAKPAELTRTYGSYGAVASMRQSWGWEVENMALVPREYLMINPDALKAAAKSRDRSGRPLTVIRGIKWVAVRKMGVR